MVGNLHFREAAGLLPALSIQRLAGRLGPQLDPLTVAVTRAGDLKGWGLPQWAVRDLTQMSDGYFNGNWDPIKAFALLTAKIGAREMEAVRRSQTSDLDAISPQEAIGEILGRLSFTTRVPDSGFMASMGDPRAGFDPFRTAKGTRIAFFANPADLGATWASIIAPRWAGGIGLILYDNEGLETAGMIFIHSLGKVSWQPRGRDTWGTSGGTMAKPAGSVSFTRALGDVIDKGVAMTDKWQAVDLSLRAAGISKETELGGSKGIEIYSNRRWDAGLAVYAEVVDLLGVTFTGSDEGLNAEWALRLAERAPKNIYGDRRMALGGRIPTEFTASGILEGISVMLDLQFGGTMAPILLQGAGGIGHRVAVELEKRGYPIAAVVEGRRDPLYGLKAQGFKGPLYRGGRGAGLSPYNPRTWFVIARDRWHGIKTRWGLGPLLREHPETRVICVNAGTHPFTFDNIALMIEAGILSAGGATNNQLGLDTQGSPDAAAWILQAGGIFHPADFVWNRLGATAVASRMIGLTDDEMVGQVRLAGAFVGEDFAKAFQQGIPPYVYRVREARRAWKKKVDSGRGIGGVQNLV